MNPLDLITAPCWLTPEGLRGMEAKYEIFLKDPKSHIEAFEAKMLALSNDLPAEDYQVVNGYAVINMTGLLMPELNFFSFLFGGTSTEELKQSVIQASEDGAVREILIVADSPGGVVYNIQETAEVVFNARSKKPITTFVKGMMASGGTYIGTAASKVYVSGDLVDVGHIGVRTQHTDISALNAKIGLNVTDFSEGEFKTLGTPNRAMTPEEVSQVQDSLKYSYDIFTRDVAKYRGLKQQQIIDMGARVFQGRQAVDIGLVDGIMSFDDLMNKPAGTAPDGKTFQINHNFNKEVVMDSRELKEKHPDTYAAILTEGKKLGIEEGKTAVQADIDVKVAEAKAEGRSEGAANESERVKSISAVSIPGHEALIQDCINDGKTTGAEAAVKVIAAQKVLMEAKSADFKTDGDGIKVPHASSADGGEGKKDFMSLVAEHKLSEKCSQGDAVKFVARQNPELHEAYVVGLKNKK